MICDLRQRAVDNSGWLAALHGVRRSGKKHQGRCLRRYLVSLTSERPFSTHCESMDQGGVWCNPFSSRVKSPVQDVRFSSALN